MGCVAEAFGLSLPGTALIPAYMAARFRSAEEAGRRIVSIVREGLTTKEILTAEALENAIRLSLAIGGSTNSLLHIPAIAQEAGVQIEMEDFRRLSEETPNWLPSCPPPLTMWSTSTRQEAFPLCSKS
jgi:dihydroxy-acid dehydratase